MSFSPFIEAPTIYVTLSSSMSNSLDTTEVDPFRQGIELTLDKYLYGGMIKIWSGEANHQLKQRQFGETKFEIFPGQTSFTDLDHFDPVTYIKQVDLTSSNPTVTYPVIVSDQQNINNLDGVIEPLTIRSIVNFSSVDAPFEAHKVYGNVEGGNYNKFTNSDRVISKVTFNQETLGAAPYEDNVDTISNLPVNIGFFPNNNKKVYSFSDVNSTNGISFTDFMSSELISALIKMNPATDGYVPTGNKSYPSGFTWQNTQGLGADSITFGNLKYRRHVAPITGSLTLVIGAETTTYANKDKVQYNSTTYNNVVGTFSSTGWYSPSLGTPVGTPWANYAADSSVSQTLAGDPTRIYSITLRLRGVVEQKTYTGGTSYGGALLGGTPAADTYNIYSLVTHDNTTGQTLTYYLNSGVSGQHITHAIDYTIQFSLSGNSTITLSSSIVDNGQIANNTDGNGGNPISIAGITDPPQPYNGQFIKVDVVSIV